MKSFLINRFIEGSKGKAIEASRLDGFQLKSFKLIVLSSPDPPRKCGFIWTEIVRGGALHEPISTTISMSVYLSIYLTIYLFIDPSIHPSIHPSISLSLSISISLSLYIYIYIYGGIPSHLPFLATYSPRQLLF